MSSNPPSIANHPALVDQNEPGDRSGEIAYPAFSLVLPIFNEELGVAPTIEHLQATLSAYPGVYEIIAVNDGSSDRTGEILHQLPGIRVIDHNINRGYGAALKTGIRHAKYSLIVITDADGTYPNERIPALVNLIQLAEADMVVGSRTGENVQYSNLRKIPKWFLVRFAEWITKTKIPDLNSGLRIFRKEIADRFLNILPNTFSFTTTITVAMLTNGYTVHYEPIDYHPRQGRSKIKPIRDTLRFVQIILRTGLYFAPMRILMPVSAAFAIGFCVSLAQDIFVRNDLTEATLILLLAATQTAILALLADMIDKRL
ncbi:MULTISPECIES: glycosyltransferase family 2 protein [Limnothrix]|uniref:Glycosyltransferase family 2 protein n=1 Tax=Limnothrix redekei LRLZ20PSL1 TaxID=3112953 RepID=A0ABW7CD91_9CYAN|nr:glycosyltransferase family 2 protein [Limnothrix sp. PR1529]OCQ98116.1 glycosyl transferase family 2 [Limnothrix sp. P13C2]PIB14966.1 glycosyl transferase family 2 [Limnothrix sp. PR1529]